MPVGLDPTQIREILINAGRTGNGESITSERLVTAISMVILENNEKLRQDIIRETDKRLADELTRAFRRHGLRL